MRVLRMLLMPVLLVVTSCVAPHQFVVSEPSLLRSLQLRPEHEGVLLRAGPEWLAYVARNVDRISYYATPLVPVDDGRKIVGRAQVARGERLARIATGDQTPAEVAATIVHEAAHLEGVRARGRTFDEEYAKRREEEFVRALRQLSGVIVR